MQVTGFSAAGKTTVCSALAAEARRRGEVVGYVKHHDGPLERQDSDTDLVGRQGAELRWLAGSDGTSRLGRPQGLDDLASAAQAAGCTFLLVEGFKGEKGAKCWLRRHAADAPPKGVSDVALDMLGAEALALGPQELLRRMPMREV